MNGPSPKGPLLPVATFLILLLPPGCGPAPREPTASPDPEYTALVRSARAAADRGSLERAVILYSRSLDRARILAEPAAIGDSAYNLAACRFLSGRLEDIHPLLEDARLAFRRLGEPSHDVTILAAKVWQSQNEPERARELASSLVGSDSPAPVSPVHRAQAWLLLAELALAGGEDDGAEAHLARADRLLDSGADPALRAARERVRAEILLGQDRAPEAAERLDREVALLAEAGLHGELVSALERAGRAHARAGDPGKASERGLDAAWSALLRGESRRARELGSLAAEWAREAGDDELERAVRRLLRACQPTSGG